MARKTSFYYSFLVLPRAERRAIVAVWDFCRAVDDAVDEPEHAGRIGQVGQVGQVGVQAAQRRAVAFWRDELARCFGAGEPTTPQGQRLRPFIEPFDLPRQAFDHVIDGVAMDIATTRYETFDDLLEYCHRVASAVGMICIRIFGCRSEGATQYALDLGVALQLTNIIRDVADDLDRGRVYLPLEDLARAGCTVEDLAARRTTEPVRRLIALECRRARDFYERAAASRLDEDRRRLVAAEIMRAVYFETLKRVEARDYDVFGANLRVPRPRQAVIALRQWLWAS